MLWAEGQTRCYNKHVAALKNGSRVPSFLYNVCSDVPCTLHIFGLLVLVGRELYVYTSGFRAPKNSANY